VDGKPHPHSFFRDGEETRQVELVAREGAGLSIKSGIDKLLVLKSTGSAFYGFHRDEYTALPETWDRILSTEVKADWNWRTFTSLDEVKSKAGEFDPAWNKAREITLATFAKDESASVQNTMYKMCDQILASVPLVESVEYSLPNKHYFEIDLSWHKGLKNTGKDAEVYAPQSNPNGLIQCTVSRKGGKARL
jgi:urate oxidase